MATKTRASKYRHVFGEAAKPEGQYAIHKPPLASGEGQYVKANAKYFAYALPSGGGPLFVHPLEAVGRIAPDARHIGVHKGKTLDWDFHPFIENMIATGSEDCSATVVQFPDGGTTNASDNITEAAVTLKGHNKKIALVQWNPTANGILATGGYDRSVKVWDVEKSLEARNFDKIEDNIYSMQWSHDGSQMAVTGKDRQLRLFDPRSPDEAQSVEAFEGTKSSKVFWVPNFGWIGSTGYSKTAKRQLKMWDVKNLSEPIYKVDIDAAASVLMPYFDEDNCILYLSGKGDGSISYFELVDDDKRVHSLSLFRTTDPQKGGGWVPKRGLNVWKCEVARFMKLTPKAIIPVSFVVPRKVGADVFQEDIYPDTYAGKPSTQAEEWLGGANNDPIKMELDPAKRGDEVQSGGGVTFAVKKSYEELESENAQLRNRIAELESQLGGGASGDAGGAQEEEQNEEE